MIASYITPTALVQTVRLRFSGAIHATW